MSPQEPAVQRSLRGSLGVTSRLRSDRCPPPTRPTEIRWVIAERPEDRSEILSPGHDRSGSGEISAQRAGVGWDVESSSATEPRARASGAASAPTSSRSSPGFPRGRGACAPAGLQDPPGRARRGGDRQARPDTDDEYALVSDDGPWTRSRCARFARSTTMPRSWSSPTA